MIVTNKVTNERDTVVDTICNKCGGSLKDGFDYEGLLEAHGCGSYGSRIGDGRQWAFSLCENCLTWLFGLFKHPPWLADGDLTEPATGALPPDDFAWQIGKTAGSLRFVRDAERYLEGATEEERKKLRKAIARVKAGDLDATFLTIEGAVKGT